MRLDRYLAELGAGTRNEVKQFIRKGRVQVDGTTVTVPDFKVEEGCSKVYLDQRFMLYQTYEYYMLNKPAGVLSAAEDKKCKTVVDLITKSGRRGLFPVGRLDKDTEGLMLITNDGGLAHRLLAPKKNVDKVYFARVQGLVGDTDIHHFQKGMELEDGFLAMPAKLSVSRTIQTEEGWVSEIELAIREGKFHQVKRMFDVVGKPVLYLKRISIGSLKLDESLEPGDYRSLTEEEQKLLSQK